MFDEVPKMIELWDDNPSVLDLLGFDAVVQPILDAMAIADLDPLTIGVQSPWGGGKSTVLNLLEADLRKEDYVVVRIDPWEYDNHADVRGAVIAEILGALRSRFKEDANVTKRSTDLLRRVSWSRVAMALSTGALTMKWDPETLVDAFTPRERSSPESMSGFRDAFGELIDALPGVYRVVVLVDDVDRCLPAAVMATLESIKLFLSVRKMVFVLAADQDMVRDAIAAASGRPIAVTALRTATWKKLFSCPSPCRGLPRRTPRHTSASCSRAETSTTRMPWRRSRGAARSDAAAARHRCW